MPSKAGQRRRCPEALRPDCTKWGSGRTLNAAAPKNLGAIWSGAGVGPTTDVAADYDEELIPDELLRLIFTLRATSVAEGQDHAQGTWRVRCSKFTAKWPCEWPRGLNNGEIPPFALCVCAARFWGERTSFVRS